MAETPSRRRLGWGLATTAGAIALSACSLAPPYSPPATTPVTDYKEAGPFTLASAAPLPSAWWTLYGDPVLDSLETRLDGANPTLAEALARYDQTRALLQEAESSLGPVVGVGAHTTYNRQSNDRPLRGSGQPNEYGDNEVLGAVAYDLDLWGRIRNAVATGRAEVQASAGDFADVRLALQSELADAYVRLRGLDLQADLLQRTVAGYQRAFDITNRRHLGGVASGLDLSRAQAQLADAQAQLVDVRAARALVEHAIATLAGAPASRFSLAATNAAPGLPVVPAGLPSTLIERRPDIAAAERRVAAANAQIGVARAAFFPDITLNASGGFQSTDRTFLFSPGDALWSLGANAAMNLFDGGLRRAVVRGAFAARAAAASDYQQRVLTAFQQVEDSLALLNRLGAEAERRDVAVQAAGRTEALSTILYQKGATNILDVTIAQTAALQARQAAIALQTRRLQASVQLIRALGGGWSGAELSKPPASAALQAKLTSEGAKL